MEMYDITNKKLGSEYYNVDKPRKTFISIFKKWMWIILLVSSVLQIIFFPTVQNLFAVCCVGLSWLLVDKYLFNKNNFVKYTFSTLIIIGYAITQYCLPTIFTLLEGKPLIYNLKFPVTVFIHSELALIILILAHKLYGYLRNRSLFGDFLYKNFTKFFKDISFYRPPTDAQIWFIGMVGILGMITTYITGNHYNEEAQGGSIISKLMLGLIPYAYAPLLLLLKPLFSYKTNTYSKDYSVKIICYTILLFAIGMAGNTRGLFMVGITSIVIAYFLGLVVGKFNYNIFNIKSLLLATICVWVLTGPLSDLGTAMVIVRDKRSETSPLQLVEYTLNTFENKNLISGYKKLALNNINDWDENYFDNIFLARFCNLKLNDASLEQAFKIKHADDEMLNYTINRFLFSLPQPLLTLFNIDFDKKTVSTFSYGDYLFYRAGSGSTLGGFRTGHFAGTGIAAFGWGYLLILFIAIQPLFFLLDLFAFYQRSNGNKDSEVYFSLCGLLSITIFFTFLGNSSSSESVMNIVTYITRSWIQLVFLYWFTFSLSRKLIRF